MSSIEQYSLILGVIAATMAFAIPIGKKVARITDTWSRFIRDWEGETEEPGRDAVPGVMERLNKLDGELSHNGGSSIKDAVSRIENILCNLDDRMSSIEEKLDL
jgi:hypothetical protein